MTTGAAIVHRGVHSVVFESRRVVASSGMPGCLLGASTGARGHEEDPAKSSSTAEPVRLPARLSVMFASDSLAGRRRRVHPPSRFRASPDATPSHAGNARLETRRAAALRSYASARPRQWTLFRLTRGAEKLEDHRGCPRRETEIALLAKARWCVFRFQE